MQIPSDIVSGVNLDCMNDFCICHFKDKNHSPEAPSHYYIVCPAPDEGKFILSITTSQVDDKILYYDFRDKEGLNSLVYLQPQDFNFTRRPSVVDCNEAEIYTKETLKQDIIDYSKDPAFRIIENNLSDEFKNKILNAIVNSSIVRENVRKTAMQIQIELKNNREVHQNEKPANTGTIKYNHNHHRR
jgi:hypothetical protein